MFLAIFWFFWIGVIGAIVTLIAEELHHKFVRSKRLYPVPVQKGSVVITGCDSGFGNMIAKKLHAQGVKVFAGCYSTEKAQQLQQEANGIEAFQWDVTSSEQLQAAVKRVEASVSAGTPLWAVVNNAGVGEGGPVEWCPDSSFRRGLDINFFAVAFTSKAFLPLLKRSRGRVVNIASVAGLVAPANGAIYCASKFAVEGFSDSLRREMRPFGIDVCLIEPGWFKTPIVSALAPLMRSRYDALPAQLRAEYGEAFRDGLVQSSEKIYTNVAQPPEWVRDAVLEAVYSQSPRARYKVGRDAQVIRVVALLPARWQDRLFALLQRCPKPAAAAAK